MRGVRLRAIAEADLPALDALDQSCFAPGIAYSQAELRGLLRHPSASSIAATRGDEIVGFAIVQSARRELARMGSYQPVLHMVTIDVAVTARRCGVGSALMGWAFDRARQLHLADILLEVAVNNHAAMAFYARYGFVRTGTIPGYYNGQLDAFTMERMVEPAGRTAS